MLDIRDGAAGFLPLWMNLLWLSEHPCDFAILEERLMRSFGEFMREMVPRLLEAWDEKLAAERDRNEWELIQRKPRTVVSTLGEITYRRRYYRNRKTGERRFLLDEVAGFEPRRRLSGKLRDQAVALALDVSYRRAAEILQTWVPDISAMAIWQEVQRLGGRSASERSWSGRRCSNKETLREGDAKPRHSSWKRMACMSEGAGRKRASHTSN
ncbi:conserved hypothetical protein [Alicyclobacillus acidocaldarius subsp. acidocaldarius Tc-4-1]|uniref:ISLre2 family transposase n=1 Tax=Alicyclobacillus acidocaldarius (strain Tc-4-1) TaxID=1048834 RepID=F8IGS7_ALIAT|nr:conserved hypothetical protein [Alicyclobacillus acidocaldarius subsp. acidocaldarius Tc-4-1]